MARRRPSKETRQKARERISQANASTKSGVKSDLAGRPDSAPGTSPSALGIVKMQSEEARLETCFECGYSAGRHGGFCSRRGSA